MFRHLFAVVVLLSAPAQAYGARVHEMNDKGPDGAGITYLSYWAEIHGEANQLSVRLDGGDYVFTDQGADVEALPPACSQEAANAARCTAPGTYYMVEVITWEGDDRIEVGPARDPLRLWGDAGNDFIASENPTAGREEFRLPYDEIDGGPGDDILLGGPGSDVISGGKFGGYFCESPATCGGHDTIDGRGGDDVVQDSDTVNGTPVDRDILSGGAGRDELDYSPRHIGAVEVSLDPRYANPAEDADVVSGFEDLTGTSGSDHLVGDGAGNRLRGWLGPDVLLARAGDDVVSGGSAPTCWKVAGAATRSAAVAATTSCAAPVGATSFAVATAEIASSRTAVPI